MSRRPWSILVFVAGFVTYLLLFHEPVRAQAPQPTMYIVGRYRSPEMQESYAIYWFEPDDRTECYVKAGYQHAGGGLSCLRKGE